MPDLGMTFALAAAEGLGTPPRLPDSLGDPNARVALIEAIEGPFLMDGVLTADNCEPFLRDQLRFISARLRLISATSAAFVPDVQDMFERLNICLRLWSGCTFAAKAIRDVDAGGTAYTPKSRAAEFSSTIDPQAAKDEVFAAGVEVAPLLKKGRKEKRWLDGVPKDSKVWRYVEEPLGGTGARSGS